MEYISQSIKEYLNKSDILRTGYLSSLGEPVELLDSSLGGFSKSKLINSLYSIVSGTKLPVSDKRMMDFIPGYRLLHISELMDRFCIIKKHPFYKTILHSSDFVVPFLMNYSSDFICVICNGGDEKVIEVLHDVDSFILRHNSPFDFINTLNEFYNKNVYFLDKDGYLDYDFELEGKIGASLNSNINYWCE